MPQANASAFFLDCNECHRYRTKLLERSDPLGLEDEHHEQDNPSLDFGLGLAAADPKSLGMAEATDLEQHLPETLKRDPDGVNGLSISASKAGRAARSQRRPRGDVLPP